MSEYRLFSWGANSHGQLGHGDIDAEEFLLPREVNLLSTPELRPENIAKIVGGAGHTLLLDKSGGVYSCGWNDKGQAGVPESTSRFQKINDLSHEKVIDVACGWNSSMALTEDGRVFTWGSNSHGQLGLKSVEKKTSSPQRVDLSEKVKRIAMGLRHSATVTRNSRVMVSGEASKGQLGLALDGDRCCSTFVEVSELNNVKDIACGQHHTAAVTNNNEVFTWGSNKYGQLGIDPALLRESRKPIKIENYQNADDILNIYCGWTHNAVLTAKKRILCWGRNTYGQLGRTKTNPNNETWKINTPDVLPQIEQLSVGSEHNIALTEDGIVVSWGWNEHGNCGSGNIENAFEATKVKLKGWGVLVGTGAGHSFAVVKTADC